MTTPTLPGQAPAPARWTPGRVLLVVTVTLMVAMWAYVLYLAVGPGRQPPPDRLDDPTFGREAQAVCDATHDDLASLPPAIGAASAGERAAVVTEANERLGTMVDDLEALAPPGEDGDLVRAWVADWRTYLDDRAAYADALRSDPEAQLLVTAKDRDHVTDYIDAFAADNRMPACATPTDV